MKKAKRKYLTVLGVKSELDKLRAEMEERFNALRDRRKSGVEEAIDLLAPIKEPFVNVDVDLAAIEHRIVNKLMQHPIFSQHKLAPRPFVPRTFGEHFIGKGFYAEVSPLPVSSRTFGEWKREDIRFLSGKAAIAHCFRIVSPNILSSKYRALRFRVIDEESGLVAWQCGPIWLTPSRAYLSIRRQRR